MINIYTLDTAKPIKERKLSFEELQIKQPVLMLRDFNVQIENDALNEIKQRFNEKVINYSGGLLVDFCVQNNFGINNNRVINQSPTSTTSSPIENLRLLKF